VISPEAQNTETHNRKTSYEYRRSISPRNENADENAAETARLRTAAQNLLAAQKVTA
jgi:hypothetical protein